MTDSLLNRLRRLIVTVCIAAFGIAALQIAHAGQNIGWMYEANVPVLNQSREARIQAAEAGFRQVLGRLTGMGEAGLTLRVSGASADRLISQFSYHSEVVNGQRQPRVKMSFGSGQVLATARQAGLPIWASSRPAVKLYLLVEAPDGSWAQLPENHPLRAEMARQAWIRGLVLSFPEFDDTRVPVRAMIEAVNPFRLEQEAAETVADAESGDPDVNAAETTVGAEVVVPESTVEGIDPSLSSTETLAPEPPPPPEPFLPGVIPGEGELILVGEFRLNQEGVTPAPTPAASGALFQPVEAGTAPAIPPGPAFSWAIGPERGVFDAGNEELSIQAVKLVDHIADELAKRFAVPWVDPRPQPLQVEGVRRVQAYAELMRYLGRQEFVSRIDLLEAGADGLKFSVVTPAAPDVLARLFKVDGRLRLDEPPVTAVEVPTAEDGIEVSDDAAAISGTPGEGTLHIDPAAPTTGSTYRWQG